MIYFDNSATTLTKPPEVAKAVSHAINTFGNAGRSFYDPALSANREIYKARAEIAKLIGHNDPLNVAFTSSSTESLNLVTGGLIGRGDHVITTVLEHNSVLRPLYLSGCSLSYIDCDGSGSLLIDTFEDLLEPETRFLVCTHGSNVTGNVTDVRALYDRCKTGGIIMILDISQTFGSIPVSMDMADIFCFTGHKSLFGPQGTGGIIASGKFDFKIVKTGGAGVNSFDAFQSKNMPDVFEVGTINSHSIYGLQKGAAFVNQIGIEEIHAKSMRLLQLFYEGVSRLRGVTVYGDFSSFDKLPVVSLSVEDSDSSEVAQRLWFGYGIATRAGSHCAPLLHKRFGTDGTGIVRFSFSYFNTEDEVQQGIAAMAEIVK